MLSNFALEVCGCSGDWKMDAFVSEAITEIRQKVLGAVKQIGDAGGYVYIMDTSMGIPYISATLSTDVTAEIKSKLGIK